jgi:predicted HTH domain antitoxin
MTAVTINLPNDVYSVLEKSPAEFPHELRVAAACHWYAQGQVSQGKAAEIAGLSRSEFLDELFRRRISAVQGSAEEIVKDAARE